MNFQEAKAAAERAAALSKQYGQVLRAFPRGPMGLTPDHIKFSPAYREAKANFDAAFERERQINAYVTKHFKKELQQDRRERYANKVQVAVAACDALDGALVQADTTSHPSSRP